MEEKLHQLRQSFPLILCGEQFKLSHELLLHEGVSQLRDTLDVGLRLGEGSVEEIGDDLKFKRTEVEESGVEVTAIRERLLAWQNLRHQVETCEDLLWLHE